MGDRGGQFKKADTPPKLFVWRGIDSVWKKGRYSLLLWSQNSKQSWQADICHLTYINHHQLINPTLSFVDILCTRVQFIQMESLSCWGWLLFDASICWGNNGNGVVKLIHCNTSKGKNVKCDNNLSLGMLCLDQLTFLPMWESQND